MFFHWFGGGGWGEGWRGNGGILSMRMQVIMDSLLSPGLNSNATHWEDITQRRSKEMLECTHEGEEFWKLLDYGEVIVFENLRSQNIFPPHYNAKPAFSISSEHFWKAQFALDNFSKQM